MGTASSGIWSPDDLEEVGIGAHYILMAVFTVVQSVLVRLMSSSLWSLWTSTSYVATWFQVWLLHALQSPTCWTLTSLVVLFVYYKMVKPKKALKSKSHLGPGQKNRKWPEDLGVRWEATVRLRGLLFLGLYVQANGMNAAQAEELMNRVISLTSAATNAAMATSTLVNEMQTGGGKGSGPRFGDGAKLLKAPDVFETDDPVKYSLWREQFLNWLVFCDSRYGDFIKDAESLDVIADMDMDDTVKKLGSKLYSIMSSYLRGQALQLIRSHQSDRNGFAVWRRLKTLVAPRARPRALAIGQAIMQHPAFNQQKSMLENLLQFDALLDQYETASGAQVPDDLVVSTILRCLDAPARRHLEMIMDDAMDYTKLKEKLILLDKNTKSWSGDHFQWRWIELVGKETIPRARRATQKVRSFVGFPYSGKGGNKGKYNNNSKGKGKNKGKKGKSKSKGKNNQKGKGGGFGNGCRICGQPG